MTIQITREDLENGRWRRYQPCHCPIALALHRAIPEVHWIVGTSYFRGAYPSATLHFDFPPDLQAWSDRLLHHGEAEPFAFTLPEPKEWNP